MGRLIITHQEIVGCHNPVYYMAGKLLDAGAPIEFNILDVDLREEDIVFTGKIKDRIRMDASHVFEWNELETLEG